MSGPATPLVATPPDAPLETDLVGLVIHVGRSWRLWLVTAVCGLVLGLGVVWLVPARFDGEALVLVRTKSEPLSGMASSMLPVANLPTSLLGGGLKDELETELAIMHSRAVAAVVVDSLRLQARMMSPARTPPGAFIDSLRLTGRFKPFSATLVPGRNQLPAGVVFVRATAPTGLHVKFYDREESIDLFLDRLGVRKAGGEVVRISFQARDSVTAADAPNLLLATYLARRKTVDRGLNQRRFEFMASASDSVGRELRAAAGTRRDIQVAGDLPAVEPAARALLEQSVDLESKLAVQRAEEAALDSALLAEGGDVRRLAASPSFVRSPAVNDLVTELSTLQTRRQALLATAPATAPSVRALDAARDSLVAQLVPMAQTYRKALAAQRRVLEQELAATQNRLRRLPSVGEAMFLAEAKVGRLTVLDNGMGLQVLQARLAALTEGGDVRVIDVAVAPRKVAFPRPTLTVALTTLLGLLFGLGLTLVRPPKASAAV